MQERRKSTDKELLELLIHDLTAEEQAAVLEVMRVMVANRSKKHTVKELRGLGKEIWHGIDAQEYVDELRGPKCG